VETESIERTTVLVCVTCRGASDPIAADASECPGAALAEATCSAAADCPDISVRRIRCLANCSRGPTAAIRSRDTWTYVFGGLDPARDAEALIAGARLLAAATDGLMPWRGRPEPLKRGLIARVPPLSFHGDPQ
jgi:predicted metal-binding protein